MDRYADLTKLLHRRCPALEVREQELMTRHTSFRIGGPARLMALPRSEAEAVAAVRAAAALEITPFFMGNGTNLLVNDRGFEGFIIKAFDGLGEIRAVGERLTAGSGVLLSKLANAALDHGLTGLEFAHGIPGSLGGAVCMDAGAYGGEMRHVVACTTALTSLGEIVTLYGAEHSFSYRCSAFSDGTRFILHSELALKRGDPAVIRAEMGELARRRREKQPLDLPSAGSVFKRPEGYYAAALIEECGLKGAFEGGAQVSEKHAGFLVNRGGATCAEVLRLVDRVRETVFQKTGVLLEMEVRTL